MSKAPPAAATSPGALPPAPADSATDAQELSSAKVAVDGPRPSGRVRPPRSTPPEENFGLPATGFHTNPERRWSGFGQKHKHVRLIPKEEGWKPYHHFAKLSAMDVMAIRASVAPIDQLAQLYGVSVSTVYDVRNQRRGKLYLPRRPAAIESGLPPEILAMRMVTDMKQLATEYRKAMRLSLQRKKQIEQLRKAAR